MSDDVQIDDHGRPEPPLVASEAATLLGFLDYQRATFAWKCSRLTDEQLQVTISPSPMTLGGMLKHLAVVEDGWFTKVIAGRPASEPWASVDWEADRDWEWHTAADDSGDYLRALWEENVARSRAIVDEQLQRGESEALAEPHSRSDGRESFSLRWGAGAHDRGVCATQRACRLAARVDRRRDRGVRLPRSG